MKNLLMACGLTALAGGVFLVGPASAHDACDDNRYSRPYSGSYYRSGYDGDRYYGDRYYGDRYNSADRYYGGRYGYSRHDDKHDRLDARHERWHDNHPFASRYDHYREHKKLATKHDVYHHRNYGEHAPNRADRYYGDDRDY